MLARLEVARGILAVVAGIAEQTLALVAVLIEFAEDLAEGAIATRLLVLIVLAYVRELARLAVVVAVAHALVGARLVDTLAVARARHDKVGAHLRALVHVLGTVDALPAGRTRTRVVVVIAAIVVVAARCAVAARLVELTVIDAALAAWALEAVRARALVLERLVRLGRSACDVVTRGAVHARLGHACVLEADGAIAAEKARHAFAHKRLFRRHEEACRLPNAVGVRRTRPTRARIELLAPIHTQVTTTYRNEFDQEQEQEQEKRLNAIVDERATLWVGRAK